MAVKGGILSVLQVNLAKRVKASLRDQLSILYTLGSRIILTYLQN